MEAAVTQHINDLLPSAEDFNAYADEVGAIADSLNPKDARLIRDAESAGRLSAETKSDPASGPDERLAASGAILDSLNALAEKCAAEGSDALS